VEIIHLLKSLTQTSDRKDETEAFPVKGGVYTAHVTGSKPDGSATLRIGSHDLKLILSQYIEPGRTVNVEVMETSPGLVLRLTPIGHEKAEPLGIPSHSEKQTTPAILSNHGRLEARILDVSGRQHIRVRINSLVSVVPEELKTVQGQTLTPGREITARLMASSHPIPLRPGQDINFIITETSPQLVLQVDPAQAQRPPLIQALAAFMSAPDSLVQSATDLLSSLNHMIDINPEYKPLLSAFSNLLHELAPKADRPDLELVNRLVALLGMKPGPGPVQEEIARLWSELIRMPQLDEFRDHPGLKNLLEASARLFDAMDQLQTLNRETLRADQQMMHLAFPIFWPDGRGRGELMIKWPAPGNARDSAAPFKVTLLLNMTALGRTRVDMEIERRKVSGIIRVETTAVRDLIARSLTRLGASLEARGFIMTDFMVQTFPPNQKPPATLVEELVPSKQGLIDVRI
jgi:hypothetical protein